MKKHLIVVGGGPAGLTAAKTAAEAGMKVILIERKKNISEINRSCLQILYVARISPLAGGKTYKEPVTVEVGSTTCRFHFLKPGFSIDYKGPLRPYLNWIQVSPSGHQVHRFKLNDKVWGFNYQKEAFLAGLLEKAARAGATIMPRTSAVGAENTKSGVKVHIRSETSRSIKTLEADNAVIAEGVMSRVSQCLGLEKKRTPLSGSISKGVWYIIEGLESEFAGSSLLTFAIPSFHSRNVLIGMMADNRNSVSAGALSYEEIARQPIIAPMLRNARVVKKLSFSNLVRTPLREPVAGNFIVAGDSAAPTETWIQGAVACGYQAVKAIEKERDGKNGYREYVDWWQHSFSFNTPDYFRVLSDGYALNRVCTDEELDYVYSILKDKVGIPAVIVDEKLGYIRKDRPLLYRKLAHRTDRTMWQKTEALPGQH